MIHRTTYFDIVREDLFAGNLTQQQVNGQDDILDVWERLPLGKPRGRTPHPKVKFDLRWLAYMLATTYHETAQTMWPIEEYGKGSGQSYGKIDPETGQTYYGRGFVQLTWRENYARATSEIKLTGKDDLEWHADKALDGVIAAKVMYMGMYEGWFRSDSAGPHNLPRYFNDAENDPYEAREIINGDKNLVPSWGGGASIGDLIEDYYEGFLDALETASDPERVA